MKKSDGFHIMVLPTSSILIRIWVEFLIGQFILEVTFSIRLGPMRWVPTAHCAGRRGLNLLTAVSPVELAHWLIETYTEWSLVRLFHYKLFLNNEFHVWIYVLFTSKLDFKWFSLGLYNSLVTEFIITLLTAAVYISGSQVRNWRGIS